MCIKNPSEIRCKAPGLDFPTGSQKTPDQKSVIFSFLFQHSTWLDFHKVVLLLLVFKREKTNFQK